MTGTTDDPTHDPTVLASAYLDGEVTPDERARVEAEPGLLEEVERLRRVRAVVATDVSTISVSTREAQLAAALDVFDQVAPVTAAPGAVTPISSGRARRERRRAGGGGDRFRVVLGVAAGLVVLAGAGAVISGVIRGADEPAGDLADEVVDQSAAEEIGPAEADVAAEIAGENTNDAPPTAIDETEVARDVAAGESIAEAEEVDAPVEAIDADVGESAPAPESDDGAGAADPSDDLATAEDPPPEVDLVTLRTPADLADFAAPAAFAGSNEPTEPTALPCSAERPTGLGIDLLAEPAIVSGLVVDVGIDLDRNVAYAYDVTCSTILQAELPTEDEFRAGAGAEPVTTPTP